MTERWCDPKDPDRYGIERMAAYIQVRAKGVKISWHDFKLIYREGYVYGILLAQDKAEEIFGKKR